MEAQITSKSAGRPRTFDVEEALEQALQLFWTKGYEGTSLFDLTEAMAISRPSLYAAFGSKEELFRKALARYSTQIAVSEQAALEMPTAREAVAAFLYGAAHALPHPEHPGCLTVVGALACSEESQTIQQELSDVRNSQLETWQQRFKQAQAERDLPSDPPAIDLARYVMTVYTGMTVQARSGASNEDLRKLVEIALRAWRAF